MLFLTVRLAYTPDTKKKLDWSDLVQSFGSLGESMRWGLRAWRKALGIIVGLIPVGVLLATRHFVFLPLVLLYPFLIGILRYLWGLFVSFLQALTTNLHGWTEAVLEWVREGYAKSLVRLLDRSVLVLLVTAVALFAIIAFVLPKVTFSFVPQSDNGSITVNVSMHNGTTLASTNTTTGALEKYSYSSPR